MRTVVIFQSDAFNTSEPRDYFINPGSFGDDVCRWLADELKRHVTGNVEEPGQEDFGWFLRFAVDGVAHDFVVGFRPDDGLWVGWIERAAGLVGSLFGGRKRGISPVAVEAVHKALTGSDRITKIRWHLKDEFDNMAEEKGSESPF